MPYFDIGYALPRVLSSEVEKCEDANVGGRTFPLGKGEDRLKICSTELVIEGVPHKMDFYGVFDGHGDGGKCSQYVADQFLTKIHSALSHAGKLNDESVTQAVTTSIEELEKEYAYSGGGTTVSCALKIGDKVYVINVGDSRTVLVKSERVYQLSEDANPATERFNRAINKMGEFVFNDEKGTPRVNGRFALARDIGAAMISSQPKFGFVELGDGVDRPGEGVLFYQKGDYLVLGTDGFWDLCTNKEAARSIHIMAVEGRTPAEMAAFLVEGAIYKWKLEFKCDGDDITVIVVKL